MIVDVADTGVGLDEDELRQLFTRFFRAKNRTTREVAGSGLGLSITRTLIEMHGGAISVESIPGEGSTFTVTLPLAEDAIKSPLPAPNAPEPLLEAPELAGGGKILLVEGDAEIANLIAHHLRRSGQTVMVAPDAATAIEMSRSEHFDLVTLDVVLPDQDGFSVLQAILETPAHDDVPVMMLSILPDDGTGTALGALDYVAKPVQEQELTERVSRILQADRAHSFLIADDDDLRDVLASEVRRLGHRVIEARDGREALEKILEHEIDLALLDVEMPGESGIEVLQAIRRMPATRHLAVIMMTGVDHVLSTGGRDPGSAHGGQMVARTLSPRDIASIVDRAVEAQAVHRA